ncbi:MAG: hypothetical protein ACJA1L_000862 [Paracoccaceae bacterium]
MKSLRILWAKADFRGPRLVLSAMARPAWPKAVTPEATPGRGFLVLTGPLTLNPGNGAPFRGLRPAGGAGLLGADLVVQAFPSVSRHGPLMPLWYGRLADVTALLTEALPRLMALERDGAPEATPTVGLAMGRLAATQEALAAGVFAPRGLRVQAWDKVMKTDRAVIPAQGAVDPDALCLAGARLREVFDLRGTGQGPAVTLGYGAGQGAMDPDRTPLRALLSALFDASEIYAVDPRLRALAALRG